MIIIQSKITEVQKIEGEYYILDREDYQFLIVELDELQRVAAEMDYDFAQYYQCTEHFDDILQDNEAKHCFLNAINWEIEHNFRNFNPNNYLRLVN